MDNIFIVKIQTNVNQRKHITIILCQNFLTRLKSRIVKELFPEKALVKEFAQPTIQKRFHSGL